MISRLGSSVPRTRWRKRSAAWSVTATSTAGSVAAQQGPKAHLPRRAAEYVQRAAGPARVDDEPRPAGIGRMLGGLDPLAGECAAAADDDLEALRDDEGHRPEHVVDRDLRLGGGQAGLPQVEVD